MTALVMRSSAVVWRRVERAVGTTLDKSPSDWIALLHTPETSRISEESESSSIIDTIEDLLEQFISVSPESQVRHHEEEDGRKVIAKFMVSSFLSAQAKTIFPEGTRRQP